MRAWIPVLALTLAGCFPASTREAQRFYVLEAPPAAQAAKAPVRVAPTTTSSFYDTQSLVYSRSPGTRGYYQFAAWTEPPGVTLGALLAERLATARAAKDAPVLHTHLVELYHDASQSPGTVRVTLRAELTDPARRETIAARSFTHTAPAASYDAEGAVRAINQTIGRLLDEVAAWVSASA
jgi:cholesterol transport system auxiliary component